MGKKNNSSVLQEVAPFVAITVFLDSTLFFGVDDYAMGFVRGALVQKIADRHRVTFKGNALAVVALGDLAGGWGVVAKNLIQQLASPWTYFKQQFDVLSWSEEAGRTFAMGILFEDYLSMVHPKSLQEDEARRVRQAIEYALHQTSFQLPPSIITLVKDTGSEVVKGMVQSITAEAGSWKGKKKGKAQFTVLDRLLNGASVTLQVAIAQIVQVLVQEGALFAEQLRKNFQCQKIIRSVSKTKKFSDTKIGLC